MTWSVRLSAGWSAGWLVCHSFRTGRAVSWAPIGALVILMNNCEHFPPTFVPLIQVMDPDSKTGLGSRENRIRINANTPDPTGSAYNVEILSHPYLGSPTVSHVVDPLTIHAGPETISYLIII